MTTSKERIFHVTEILFQQMIAVFVLLVLWQLFISNSPVNSKGTWHIILCVTGFALCMAEGVQIFRHESVVTFGNTREEKKLAHMIVMAFAFVCITIGISLKISQKEDSNRAHFTSTHGILGLITWIFSFITALGGVITMYFRHLLSPRVIKLCHILLGITTYALGVATLCYGLQYMYGTGRGWVALVVLLVVYATYSLIGPFKSIYNYLRND
ncbi:probable transmembrane reductase CYB561D1 [Diabrotica virgifera virgifera]|uniref:ascorbate ferrireductase (transmembrane) n=1 Tax=Diabrotica virgifera virgifera TaxID=50390 RepID=A0ABM5IN68_DIAVI|nr:probable transmembrane reductase CYB561D1 [Diabrotica virgifera virgifera]